MSNANITKRPRKSPCVITVINADVFVDESGILFKGGLFSIKKRENDEEQHRVEGCHITAPGFSGNLSAYFGQFFGDEVSASESFFFGESK